MIHQNFNVRSQVTSEIQMEEVVVMSTKLESYTMLTNDVK